MDIEQAITDLVERVLEVRLERLEVEADNVSGLDYAIERGVRETLGERSVDPAEVERLDEQVVMLCERLEEMERLVAPLLRLVASLREVVAQP